MLNKYLKKTLFSVFFITCCFSELSLANLPSACPSLASIEKVNVQSAKVDWIPDGDTIHTASGVKLRLLNINSPEINPKSNKPPEPLSKSAQKRLLQLIGPSNQIFWVRDKRIKDKYKRELAYVFNNDGLFLNAQLALEGLAHTLVIPPNQNYWSCIVKAEGQAFKNNIGIWKHAYFQAKSVTQVLPNQGFQLVTGKITQIIDSNKYRWLVLDNRLWVGISRKNFQYFEAADLNYSIGDTISVRGFAYNSHNELRMKLQHPAMIFKK
jgi:endonuclease YncB( thermonuclease family)